MTTLAICTIAKNEARYIREWIEYHLLIGVEKIYVYDNGSEDDLAGACAPYPEVTLIDWPTREDQQQRAYRDYLERFSGDVDWTAFIDADEFICHRSSESLTGFLAAHKPDHAGFELPWVIFDCNGHDRRPPGLVLENYTRAHGIAPQQNVKSICQSALVDRNNISSPHRFNYASDLRPVETAIPDLCIFHYMLRSREDVYAKVVRGDAWSAETERKRLGNVERAVQSILTKYDNADTEQRHMLQYVPKLKQRLSERTRRSHR